MKEQEYSIHTDIKFGPLELVDVRKLADECEEKWFNQTLCKVNDGVVRFAVIQGEFHWHKHHAEDEFFYVVEGKLLIDLNEPEERTIELEPRQGYLVPHGTVHRTRAPGRTVILLVAPATVVPTGDA